MGWSVCSGGAWEGALCVTRAPSRRAPSLCFSRFWGRAGFSDLHQTLRPGSRSSGSRNWYAFDVRITRQELAQWPNRSCSRRRIRVSRLTQVNNAASSNAAIATQTESL